MEKTYLKTGWISILRSTDPRWSWKQSSLHKQGSILPIIGRLPFCHPELVSGSHPHPNRSSEDEEKADDSDDQTRKKTEETKIETRIEVSGPARKFTYWLKLFDPPGHYPKPEKRPEKTTDEKSLPWPFPWIPRRRGTNATPPSQSNKAGANKGHLKLTQARRETGWWSLPSRR